MAVKVVSADVGLDSFRRLAATVAEHKATDPLAPVTVVVGANSIGVAARRHLARHGNGIVGASFVTPYRLAELLAGADLANQGRRPVSTATVAAAARRALASTTTRFAAVAEHPATEAALVRAVRDLDVLDDDELDRLAARGGRPRDVVTLFRSVRAVIEPSFHTERDLVDAATSRITAGGLPSDFGLVIVFDPDRIARPAIRMLRAIADCDRLVVITSSVGDATLDVANVELVAALGGDPNAISLGVVADRKVEHIVSYSDADDECRGIVRSVVTTARSGVPFERMAVVIPAREPYARLMHEHLDAAAVPHNGLTVTKLADTVAGRTLTRALALADRGFRRADVLALAAAAPVRLDGRPARVGAWERESRRAGVIGGLEQWRTRLTEHARRSRDHQPWAVETCSEMLAFVEMLAATIDRAERATSWARLAHVANDFLRRILPSDTGRADWPTEQALAYERVQAILDRLAHLDPIEPRPAFATFRRALAAELDVDLGRVGRIGEGVLVGTLDLVVGVETDAVFVAGLAEGTFPSRHQDDSLLPDSDRAAIGTDVLPDRRRRARAEHRKLLHVLAMGQGSRWLSQPRGDLRRNAERPLSRYALDAVEASVGVRPDNDELTRLQLDGFELVPSFAAAVRRCAFPANEQEFRLRWLSVRPGPGGAIAQHPIVTADRALGRAVDLLDARNSSRFTRFDGNLTGHAIPALATEAHPASATRIEQYAINPMGFFFAVVLGVVEHERPEALDRMRPMDKGNLYHEVLERFVTDVLERTPNKPATEPWSPDDRARLHEIAAEVSARFEQLGLTGRARFWEQDRRRLAVDLDRFLDDDDVHRRDHDCQPIAAEFRFGRGGPNGPVSLRLTNGRVLYLSGSADRVDRTGADGFWVLDYKTGSNKNFAGLSEDDPDAGGTKLQLPIYAHAVRAVFGAPTAPVTAAYRFITRDGQYRDVPVPLVPSVEARIDTVLTQIVALAESGLFPNPAARPDSWTRIRTSLTDPDGRAGADAAQQWERKLDDPALEPLHQFFGVAEHEPEATAPRTSDEGST